MSEDPYRTLMDQERAPPAPIADPAVPGNIDSTTADAAGQAPPADPYRAMMDADKQGQAESDRLQAQLIEYHATSDATPPAVRADVLRYTAALNQQQPGANFEPKFVQDNLEAVRKQVDGTKPDWADVATRQPVLMKYLAENLPTVPVVKDDVASLGPLEWAIGTPYHAFYDWVTGAENPQKLLASAPMTALWDAINQQRAVARQFAYAHGMQSEENKAAIVDLEERYSNRDYGANNLLTKGIVGLAKMAPFTVMDKVARLAGAAVAGASGAGAGAAGGAAATVPVAGAGAIPGAGVGAVGGAVAGQFLGSALFNYYEALGPLYWQLDQIRDANGQPLDEVTKQAFARAGAVSSGLLMAGTMGVIGKGLFGAAVPSVEKALVKQTVGRAVGGGLYQLTKHEVLGAGTMAAQSALNAAAAEGAKATSSGDFQTQWDNVGTAAAQGFKTGFEDMWLLAAIGPVREGLRGVGRARASEQGAARLEAAVKAVGESKLFAEVPAEGEKLLVKMKDGPDALQAVYVPVEEWNRYWQGEKLDPAEVAGAVVGDGGKGYNEAKATGGDLVIPIEKYLSKLGRTEHAQRLAPDVKTDPELLTPRQFQLNRDRLQARMKEEANAPAPEKDQRVYEDFRAKAIAAGAHPSVAEANARLVDAGFRRLANFYSEPGKEVNGWAVYQETADVRIHGPGTEQPGSALAQGAREPGSMAAIREAFAKLNPEEQMGKLYRDRNTGLLNGRGFAAAPRDPARPFLAEFEMEGSKFTNDAHGHEAFDGALRTMAGVLEGNGVPDGAKLGGSVRAWVKDPAQARAIADAMEANLGAGVDKVRVTTATSEAKTTLPETFQALGEAHKGLKASEILARKLGARKGAPNAFMQGAPDIAWQEGMKGLAPDSLEAKAALAKAAELSAPFAKRQREAVAGTPVPLGPEHAAGFEQAKTTAVDTIHKEATGLLTDDGFHEAQKLQSRKFTVSADMRGLRPMNDAFGEQGANVILKDFSELIAEKGGGEFDAAHPHGDEFFAQGDNKPALEAFFAAVKDVTDKRVFYRVLPDGRVAIQEGLYFAHGIGENLDQADRIALPEAKRQQGAVKEPRIRSAADAHGELEALRRGGYRLFDVQAAVERGLRQGTGGAEGAAGRPATEVTPGSKLLQPDVPLPEGGGFRLNAEGGRGFIVFNAPEGGAPRRFDIHLLAGADESTLAHETAHMFGEILSDLARRENAPLALKDDYSILLRYLGYETPAERIAAASERRTLGATENRTPEEQARFKKLSAKEEKLSHAWEQYLAEGKAPALELRGPFTRFRVWMGRLYQNLTGAADTYRAAFGEELALSDDVRRVFDRFLATDQALAEARGESGAGALTPPDVVAGMAAGERAALEKAKAEARQAAQDELDARAVDILKGKVGEARKDIEAKVTSELDAHPVYRAMRYLQRGELVDAKGDVASSKDVPEVLLDKNGQPFKLQREAFVKRFGPDAAREMPSGVFGTTKKAGVDVDQLAPLLGYESGEALVREFRRVEPREKVIAKRTQDQVDARYGPALKELNAAAMSAVRSDKAAEAYLLESRAMAKQVNPKAAARVKNLDLATMKSSAAMLVEAKLVSELDPQAYSRTERQATIDAAELWGKGQKEQALELREKALLNQVLFRTARDAKDRLDVARAKLEKTSDAIRSDLGLAGPEYRDVHDQVVAAVGLGQALPEGRTLDQLLTKADQDGQQVAFDVDAIRRLLVTPTPWDSLTVTQASNVADTITNLRHLAKEALQLDLAGKKETKDAWFADFATQVSKREPLKAAPYSRTAEGFWDKAKHLGRGVDALLTDVAETYSTMLDVQNSEGPVSRLLVRARLEAREKAAELTTRVLKKIVAAWENVPADIRKLRDQRVDVSDFLSVPSGTEGRLAPVFTRDNIWSLYLNWGNEGNRQRIRDGFNWGDGQVERALSMLSKPEVQFLQGVLDTINSLWPEVSAAHEKRTGLKLGKVEATPITINGETTAGGYFPLRYDPRIAVQGEMQEGDVIKSLFGPNYVKPTTPKSHTKTRFDKVNAPPDLTWGVVPAHLSQVVHDLAYGDWVRQAGGILLDPRFKALTTQYLGPERAAEFVPWLRDVANARADSAAGSQSAVTQRIGSWARNRTMMAVLGMNIPATLPQLLDGWNARQEGVPVLHIANAYLKVNSLLAGLTELPELKLSKELAYREGALKHNLRVELERMGPTGGGLREVSEVAFSLYEYSDRYTTKVGFKAAYDHAMSEGLTQTEAVRRADDVVRKIWASYDIAEKPPILRSKRGLAAVVMFYSFANRMYNTLRRSVDTVGVAFGDKALPAEAKRAAVVELTAKLLVLGLSGAAYGYISGRGPKDDEDPAKWAFWRIALEPLNTVPFLGAAAEGLVKGQKVSMRTAPELALLQDGLGRLGDLVGKAEAGAAGDSDKAWAAAEALLGTGLFVAGAPVGQIERTAGYAKKLVTGEAQPRGPLDVAGGLIYGKRKAQGANPLTDLQDLVNR